MADTADLNPPDWAGADNTVYAHWEFAVLGYGNPDGLADYHDGPGPAFIRWNTMGWADFKAGRQGIQKNGEARFIVDNYTRDNARKKRIRVQAIYYSTPPNIEAETDDGETPVVYIPPATVGGPIQTYDLGDGWYHGTWEFDFDSTNPGKERISIIGSFLDEIVIDTACYEGTDPNAGPGRGRDIGITEVFGSTTSSAYRSAMPFHMPEDGSIESITMYHNSSGSGNLIFGIYTGGSAPDARIAVTPQTPITTIEEWQTVDLSEPVYIGAGTKIWLAWVYENNPGIRYADGSPGRVITSPPRDWNDTPPMPDPFGGSWQDDYIVSIYATYKPIIGPPDLDPPAPDPAEWALSPGAEEPFSISMTATTATDYSGVSYYFEEISGNFGGESSGWQESPTYTDTGLAPEIEYTYRVKTRDYSLQLNEGAWSTSASATTDQISILECPEGDLNTNCEIEFDDLLIFVEQWLDEPDCPGHPADCADLDEQNDGIDSEDFAVISANWRELGVSGSLVINEFMASNNTKIADEYGEYDDWIEIYNRADYAINMGGMYLADSSNTWEIPADVLIGPSQYKLFWADADWPSQGDTHTNFKLDKDGDEITLYAPDGTTEIDSVSWTQDQLTDESYGRYPDAEDAWYVMNTYRSSPGLPNDIGRSGNVRFSHPGCTFTDSMSVGLACKSPTTSIYYTLNGDKPTTGTEYTGGLIPINKTRRVRARAQETGMAWGPSASETYIKIGTDIDDFQTNLPIVLIDTLGFEIDEYEWDRDDHPVIAAFIDTDQLTGITRITDPVDWAGYAGMHVRGNSSAGYDKKQYKFETWDELEQDKSVSLLGMPSESDWILYGPFSDKTLMRNHLAYTWNRQMGRYGVRCRFIELFVDIDGVSITQADYHGVYVFMEDIKRDQNRVDITRIDPGDNSEPEITGGYLLKKDWVHSGDRSFYTNYYSDKLIYVDPDGDEITTAQKDWLEDWFYEFELDLAGSNFDNPAHPDYYGNYIDILSFIDHHILVEISKNVDGYCLSTFLFKDRLGKLNMGPVWDYNGSLGNADYFYSWVIEGWHFNTRNPEDNPNSYEWYERLWQDPEFRLAYADRWWDLREDLLSNSGVLADIDNNVTLLTTDVTGENAVDRNFTRWDVLYDYIWPNYYCCGSYAEHIDWMKYWICARLDWLDIGVGNDCGSAPPTFNQNGGYVSSGFDVTISGSGTIYYTTDGSDPRAYGGAIAGTEYTAPINLTTTTQVKARIKNGSDWSALRKATFVIDPVADYLRITEIMYHPPDPNHEFIELKNTGPAAINLNLVKFTNGIDFTFPSMTLDSGNHVVVVRNQTSFMTRHPGVPAGKIAGEFSGAIDNAGERIELADGLGMTILNFEFKDGWYPITDGDDFSLNIIDPTNPDPNSWEHSEYWQPSSITGGTPANDDSGHVAHPPDIVINEVMTHTNSYPNDWIELHNTTGASIDITGWFLTDDEDSFRKYEIQSGDPRASMPPGGYVVFTQNDDFGNVSDPGSDVQFALSELGETVYLCSGSGGQLAGGFCAKEDFKASEDNVSFGRYTKSAASGYNVDFISMAIATSGSANTGPKVGPIVITEIMYHPGSTDPCHTTNPYAEYVELKNISGTTISLDNWLLTDEDEGIEYHLPAGTSLAGGEYLLLVKNEIAFNEEFTPAGGVTILQWVEGRLSNSGEKIQISKPGTPEPDGYVPYIRVDRVNYSDGSHGANFHELACNDPWPTAPDGTGQALHRITDGNYGNDVANWIAAAPTPGEGDAEPGSLSIDLNMDDSWMYQNLSGSTKSNLTATASVISDPAGNSSYSYIWEFIDVSMAPSTVTGGGTSDTSWIFAAPGCNEPNGLSDSGQVITVTVMVTGVEHDNSATAEAQFGIALLGDVNNDGVVNVADRSITNAFWRLGTTGSFTFRDCDINCDEAVNVADRAIANAVWRGTLGQSSVTTPCPLR